MMTSLDWALDEDIITICVRHLGSNFHSKFHDKSLKLLLVRAAYKRQLAKFEYSIEQVARISPEAHG